MTTTTAVDAIGLRSRTLVSEVATTTSVDAAATPNLFAVMDATTTTSVDANPITHALAVVTAALTTSVDADATIFLMALVEALTTTSVDADLSKLIQAHVEASTITSVDARAVIDAFQLATLGFEVDLAAAQLNVALAVTSQDVQLAATTASVALAATTGTVALGADSVDVTLAANSIDVIVPTGDEGDDGMALINLCPVELDLCVTRGDNTPFFLAIKDSAGAALDIASYTFRMAVDPAETPDPGAPIFSLAGVIVVPATNGIVQFSPTSANNDPAAGPAEYFWDCEMTTDLAKILTIAKGKYTIEQDISK